MILFGHRASRKQTYALVGLTGHSGKGKTKSALRLAEGLADGGLVGMIDTENGRGEMYSDEHDYHVEPLVAPFTPQRYAAAIEKAEAAGVSVLIIDSFSHEWEGTGGVLEMAEAVGGKGLQKWNKPKTAHKRMVNTMLQSRMHNIICMRGKDEIEKQIVNGKEEYVKTGVVLPIQEQRIDFEMTVSLIMTGDGRYTLGKNCPGKLRPFFDGSVITEDLGRHLLNWLKCGEVVDPRAALLARAKGEAAFGSVAFKSYWQSLRAEDQAYLKQFAKELATIRDAADDAMQVDPTGDGSDDPPVNQEQPLNGMPDFAGEIAACKTKAALDALDERFVQEGINRSIVGPLVMARAAELSRKKKGQLIDDPNANPMA